MYSPFKTAADNADYKQEILQYGGITMKTDILCGADRINLEVPDGTPVLDPQAAAPIADTDAAILEVLQNPIDSAPLAELAKGKRDACIVISDITRPVPNHQTLPPMCRILEEAGIPRDRITILIATGMHRPNLDDELESMVGEFVMKNYNIVNHYCHDDKYNVKVCELDGADIELNKAYIEADLKILTGLIEPHMYAGYSGGRKSILPGISSYKTMTFMHSYKMIDHPNVTNCKLDGNPFHEAGQRICKEVGVDFILNVVINKQREMVGVFAGHYETAHRAGCDYVSGHSVHSLDERVDLVVTSAGGYPLDATFYQVSKGLIMARGMVKKTGAIVIACECREGVGSEEYCSLVDEGMKAEEFFEKQADPDKFVIDQWCLQTTYQALDHAEKVYVYSPYLTAEQLEPMGFIKIDDVQATVDELLKESESMVVVPEGPYVVGLVKDM